MYTIIHRLKKIWALQEPKFWKRLNLIRRCSYPKDEGMGNSRDPLRTAGLGTGQTASRKKDQAQQGDGTASNKIVRTEMGNPCDCHGNWEKVWGPGYRYIIDINDIKWYQHLWKTYSGRRLGCFSSRSNCSASPSRLKRQLTLRVRKAQKKSQPSSTIEGCYRCYSLQ